MNNDFRIDLGNGMYLAHKAHKYIKREWQGKGWRYWYGTGYKDDANQAKHISKNSANESVYLRKLASTDTGYTNVSNLTKSSDTWDKWYKNKMLEMANRESKKSAEYARTAYNSQKLYEKSLAAQVEKGKAIVSNLLNKLGKSANKAKKSISKSVVETAKKLGAKPTKIETITDISSGQKYKRVNGGKWEKVK